MGRGVPSPSKQCLGEHRKLPQRGPGQSPDRKWILCLFEVRNKSSRTPFTVFLSDGGPQKHCGARENVLPFQWRIQLWADRAASPPPIDQNLGLVMAARLRHCGKFSPKSLTFGHFCVKMYKKLSASGGLRPPNPPHQGLCPWTPLGAPPPDPRLGSRSARSPWSTPLPPWQILDPPLPSFPRLNGPAWHCP